MSEYVDNCDLLLCQTSVSSPKTRDWWQDTKTHSDNKRRYWGGDWGMIINGERAAGQRCSPKTSPLSPRGQDGASINWQADVLEFLSWALVGWWDAGLQCFENQCGFPHQTRPLGPLICWVVCVLGDTCLLPQSSLLPAPHFPALSFSATAAAGSAAFILTQQKEQVHIMWHQVI